MIQVNNRLYICAVIIELVGIILVTSGLVYEELTKADLGYMMITGGSLIMSIGAFIFAKVVQELRWRERKNLE